MKSIIIIVSLIVTAEGVGNLEFDNEDRKANLLTEVDESIPKSLSQSTHNDIDHTLPESDTQYLHTRGLDEDLGKIIGPATATEKPEIQSTLNFNKMLQVAAKTRDNEIKDAQLQYEQTKKDIEAFKQQATTKRDKISEYVVEKYDEEDALAHSIMRKASSFSDEARQKAQKKYIQEIMDSIDKDLREAGPRYDAAIEAAGQRFLQQFNQLSKKKQNMEQKNRNILEKARAQKGTALRLAQRRLESAKSRYEEAKITESEYENEKAAYQQAVTLAQDKWLKVLDDIGISKFDVAFESEVARLKKAREDAAVAFDDALRKYDEDLDLVTKKKRELNKSIRAASLKLLNEYEKMMEKADDEAIDTAWNAWEEWREGVAEANKNIEEAQIEFATAKQDAIRKWKDEVDKINALKREQAQKVETKTMTPSAKTVGQNALPNRGSKQAPSKSKAKKDASTEKTLA